MFHFISEIYLVVIFPAMKVVAQLASFWNIPTFSWNNPGLEFDKKEYPTLIRMSPPNDIMGKLCYTYLIWLIVLVK